MSFLSDYLLFINLTSFLIMVLDKQCARRGTRRVPEKTLFLLAWLGGATGVYLAMKLARHKTKHRSFNLGIPILIILNISMVFFLQVLNRS